MNETFRISDAAVRFRRRNLVLGMLFGLGFVGLMGGYGSKDPVASIAVFAILIGIMIFIVVRQSREFAKFAAQHSLTLEDDVMLFRDGDVEIRVAYSAVLQVTIPRTLRDSGGMFVKCRDQPRMHLYGYERFPRLVELLLKKVPHAEVRTRGFFVFGTSRG